MALRAIAMEEGGSNKADQMGIVTIFLLFPA
jgi:hypothetical protein